MVAGAAQRRGKAVAARAAEAAPVFPINAARVHLSCAQVDALSFAIRPLAIRHSIEPFWNFTS
jgi:hypothetical protein